MSHFNPSAKARPAEINTEMIGASRDPATAHSTGRSSRWPGISESDRVYELLRGDLVAGLYAPGEPLAEEALAKRYEASRTPVRAAMLRLVGDRLLEGRSHASTFVREITPRDIRQIYDMRQAVEGFAVDAAVQRISAEQLRHLMPVASEASPDVVSPDAAPEGMFHQGVTPLHRLIVESMGNGRLTDVLCTQSLGIARTQALYWRMANPRVDELDEIRRTQALVEHQEIVQALLDRDADTARTTLISHLEHGANHLIEMMTTVDLEEPRSSEALARISRCLPNILDHMLPGARASGEEAL